VDFCLVGKEAQKHNIIIIIIIIIICIIITVIIHHHDSLFINESKIYADKMSLFNLTQWFQWSQRWIGVDSSGSKSVDPNKRHQKGPVASCLVSSSYCIFCVVRHVVTFPQLNLEDLNTGSTIITESYMRESTLKIDRYSPLVM